MISIVWPVPPPQNGLSVIDGSVWFVDVAAQKVSSPRRTFLLSSCNFWWPVVWFNVPTTKQRWCVDETPKLGLFSKSVVEFTLD